MIDHTCLQVSSARISRSFYEKALAPLGYRVLHEIPLEHTGGAIWLGMGFTDKADFWLNENTLNKPPVHVAFRTKSSAEVDAFYQSALAAGGRDNGAPGPRSHYPKTYYGAFVLDPDGHNIEAVFFSHSRASNGSTKRSRNSVVDLGCSSSANWYLSARCQQSRSQHDMLQLLR